jgi:hypothetical protein
MAGLTESYCRSNETSQPPNSNGWTIPLKKQLGYVIITMREELLCMDKNSDKIHKDDFAHNLLE